MVMHVIFYEDQAADPENYGPHALVLSCVADQTGHDRFSLSKRFRAKPCKGDSKLLAALSANAHRNPNPTALFDNDRIRKLLNLTRHDCKRNVILAITGRPGMPTDLRIVLLEQNTESLLNACLQLSGRAALDAGEKPDPARRDSICLKLASEADPHRRKQLVAILPSFARLVRRIAELLDPR